MRILTIAAPVAATGATGATPAIARTQEKLADVPFTGIRVGGAFGIGVQPNDNGLRILFDRNFDGDPATPRCTRTRAGSAGGTTNPTRPTSRTRRRHDHLEEEPAGDATGVLLPRPITGPLRE